jgi:hypothetical protein
MDTKALVEALDAEIATLKQVRAILEGNRVTSRGRSAKAGKRTISAEGRARIAAAQKARWAKTRRS